MLNIAGKGRYYLYRNPTDMRKSFDGLSGLIRREMALSPQSGDVYLFVNRRADRIKFMVWDRDGFWIYYKRLEKGVFSLPQAGRIPFEISYDDLVLMLAGIEVFKVKKKTRFGR
ncbi:MAG: IS66 family insertion sequence element accessory protein TnpB [Candidatus Marinimicrobia bacterium]|nr:IS66 family insertion sequence element accessory protein TnpB [Candidatus Neomarinimicrobiota bacterium]